MKKLLANLGFTLVEMIIVLSIIGLIITVSLVGVREVRMRINDGKRIADLNMIKAALELYYLKNNKYPAEFVTYNTGCDASFGRVVSSCCNNGTGSCGSAKDWYYSASDGQDLNELVNQGYLTSLPNDPVNVYPYFYRYEQDGNNQGNPGCPMDACRYSLNAFLEKDNCIYNIQGGFTGTMATAEYTRIYNGVTYHYCP